MDDRSNLNHPTLSIPENVPETSIGHLIYLYFDPREQSNFNDCTKVLEAVCSSDLEMTVQWEEFEVMSWYYD